MNLFYEDLTLSELEKKLDYSSIIKVLEKKFSVNEDVKIINSLVAYSWFFFIEGDVNQKPLNFDPNFFLAKWKYFIDKGLEKFADESLFCLIAGYTLKLHGFYISSEYEFLGSKLLNKCVRLSSNNDIKELASYWLKDSKKSKKININSIAYSLFDGNLLLNKYFVDLLTKQNIQK